MALTDEQIAKLKADHGYVWPDTRSEYAAWFVDGVNAGYAAAMAAQVEQASKEHVTKDMWRRLAESQGALLKITAQVEQAAPPVAEWVNAEFGFQALIPTASIPDGAQLYTAPPKAVPLTAPQTIRTNSQIEHELEAMKRYIKQITKDKSSAVAFLSRAGIIDGNGELAEQYRAVEAAIGTPATVEKG